MAVPIDIPPFPHSHAFAVCWTPIRPKCERNN